MIAGNEEEKCFFFLVVSQTFSKFTTLKMAFSAIKKKQKLLQYNDWWLQHLTKTWNRTQSE